MTVINVIKTTDEVLSVVSVIVRTTVVLVPIIDTANTNAHTGSRLCVLMSSVDSVSRLSQL